MQQRRVAPPGAGGQHGEETVEPTCGRVADFEGSMRRRRRTKYRVGPRTVNFTSLALVASAIVVVLEVTAPSSVPPVVFASAAHADSPGSPTATPTPPIAASPVVQPPSVFGDGVSSSVGVSGAALGATVGRQSPSGSTPATEVVSSSTPAAGPSATLVEADVQNPHGVGLARARQRAQHGNANAATASTQRQRQRQRQQQRQRQRRQRQRQRLTDNGAATRQ